jgi:hypothetical protein
MSFLIFHWIRMINLYLIFIFYLRSLYVKEIIDGYWSRKGQEGVSSIKISQ